MDCFRFLACGFSTTEIQSALGLHSITVEAHLQALRKRLRLGTRGELRTAIAKLYARGKLRRFSALRFNKAWAPTLVWLAEQELALSECSEELRALRLCTRLEGIPPKSDGDVQRFSLLSSALKADLHSVACGYENGLVKVWDALEGRCLHVFEGHTAPISCLSWHPGQRYLVSGSRDQTIHVWDAVDGKLSVQAPLECGRFITFAVIPDGV
jgi:DNA-binding CsgD family transcriptional regulator